MNLFTAVTLAESREAMGWGVLVCLNDRINAARDVRQTDNTALDTFRSPELGFLGSMQGGRPVFYRETRRRHTTRTEFDTREIQRMFYQY